MIELRKWSYSSDVDAAALAEKLEQLLLAVYGISPWTTEQVAEVLQIAVLPSYQGQKIATALFDFLPADKEIFLEVRESNRPALLFYKKERFEEIARRKAYYHAPVEDAIVMKREIHGR